MWIIIGMGIGTFVFVVGLIIGECRATEPLPRCCLECLRNHNHDFGRFSPDCCDHYGLGSLRNEVAQVKSENYVLRRQIEFEERKNQAHREECKPRIYAKSLEEQEIIDLLKKGKEIKKK